MQYNLILNSIFNCFLYNSLEIFCVIGIILNFICYFIPKAKINTKRLSSLITASSLILGLGFLFFNFLTSATFINFKILSENTIIFKIIVDILMLFFVFGQYRTVKKTGFDIIILNSLTLGITFFSLFLLSFKNFIFTYLFLEIISFLIYKFSSLTEKEKENVFSVEYILISAFSSVLFLLFYVINIFIKNEMQNTIIQIALMISYLLKIGFFPIFNYLINDNKNNICYRLLFNCYFPFLGIISCGSLISILNFKNEVFQLTILGFLLVCGIFYSIFAYRQKNLEKYLAQCAYCLYCFPLISLVLFPYGAEYFKMSALYTISFFGLYSILTYIKSNSQYKIMNLQSIKGLFYNRLNLTILFIILILMTLSAIPSGILTCLVDLEKNIFLKNNTYFLTVLALILFNILAFLGSLKFIQECFKVTTKDPFYTKKGTNPNMVIPLLVIIFLLIKIFL